MKKILFFIIIALGISLSANAVLKEKDLARTLGVLRAELEDNYRKQQVFMQMYKQQEAQQHLQLVDYMTKCEQTGLMLYSQNTDNTFDMAYACQQATNLYRELHERKGGHLPYDKIITRMKADLERYDALIHALRNMPPVVTEKLNNNHDHSDSNIKVDGVNNLEAAAETDSMLLQVIDSLKLLADSISKDTAAQRHLAAIKGFGPDKEDNQQSEPLYLTGQLLEDRNTCLEMAEMIRENLFQFVEKMDAQQKYYQMVQEKAEHLNNFAASRYKMIQDNIFVNGGANYFSMLASFSRYWGTAKRAWETKYKPFEGKDVSYSEWRGAPVMFISIFVIFYLTLALGITYIILRWCLPKRWRGKEFRLKRAMLNNVIGIALFGLVIAILHVYAKRNFIQMGTEMILNMAWLLEVIFVSLYIRLKGEQMIHAAKIYTPLMMMAFIVILFRIILIPNSVVNLIYPPILLGFTIWQIYVANRHRKHLPMIDVFYANGTSLVMIAATISAWSGFTLLAVQIMIWWTFQLAAIMTITCIYDIMEMFEQKYMLFKVRPDLLALKQEGKDITDKCKAVLDSMQKGDYIEKTWFYDLTNRTLVPILAVASVLVSIYWAADIFEMTSVCREAFKYNFVEEQDLIQISLSKLCTVTALWFIFHYINYAMRSFYLHTKRKMLKKGEVLNATIARNIMAILIWGLYFIIFLVVLKVPKSGISIVTAGLATGLGFAMQDLIQNFFYGISLMTGRLRVGDYIECDGIAGKVESITYQSTQIITADGCIISFLNNALFSKNFKNMTKNHNFELIKIPVGVAYGSNIDAVRKILIDALTPICREKDAQGRYLTDIKIPVSVAFSDFGDSSVDLKVCIWMRVESKIALMGRVKEVIYNTLNANNIEIPFPQRDIHIIK